MPIGFWEKEYRKFKQVFKVIIFMTMASIFGHFLVTKPNTTLTLIGTLLVGMALRKSWFLFFFSFVAWNTGEEDFTACAKRLADWLEKLSVAAIIPFLGAALLDETFLQNKEIAVKTAALVVIVCFFCSMRYTKYVAEGLFVLKKEDDVRDILRFGGDKDKIDSLPDGEVRGIMDTMNASTTELDPAESVTCRQHQYSAYPRTNRSRVYRQKIRLSTHGKCRRRLGVGQFARRPS